MIDIYHSRRNHFWKCRYWIRDLKSKIDINQYVLDNKPSGIFFAKQERELSKGTGEAMNVVLFDTHNVQVTTNDIVNDLEKGSIVEFEDLLWFVESVQQAPHLKESQFKKKEYTTYITLKR